MAKPKTTKLTICVDENNVDIKDIYSRSETASFEELVAAKIILDDQIAHCQAVSKNLEEIIAGKTMSSIANELVSKGVLPAGTPMDGLAPSVEVTTVGGDKITVTLSEKERSGFDASGLKEKSIFDTLVPEAYKKHVTMLNSSAVEAAFNDGTLDPFLKSYCSASPATVIALSRPKIEAAPDPAAAQS